MFYRKQLLLHVLARIKPGSKVSDVITSVDLLKCFCNCGFSEATLELFIDHDADAEFSKLQNYISEISPDSTVDSYLNQDEDDVTSVNTVDIHSMNWKEDIREKAICFAIEGDDETEKQAEADGDFDIERPELKYNQVKLPHLLYMI